MQKIFSISIVSHGHKKYIEELIQNIRKINRDDVEIILISNIHEKFDVDYDGLSFPLRLIENSTPKGFAENHN
ncbi:hypothetical protein QN360_18855, partial [Glaciimonas sp. CA11.2]|nr:hypothetical protein [Glaciimonas sp. CA11.2]